MGWFNFRKIDLAAGELPGWLNNMVALARPIAVTMTVAIPPIGAFSVGAVAFKWPEAANAMAEASVKFLQGIPDAAYAAITAIALGYTAAKSVEQVKKPAPSPTPEQGPNASTAVDIATTETLEFAGQPAFLRRTEIPPVQFGGFSDTDIIE